MALTGKQTRHLRALGHHLDPVVQIGKHGLTEALVAQLSEAIAHHELIKVKLLPECPIERREAGEEVAQAIGAELAQTLGRTLLFWKRNPQKAKIEIPNARGELKSAARKEVSKGKLPPSRARAQGDGAAEPEETPARRAAPSAKRAAPRDRAGAPAKRTAPPRAKPAGGVKRGAPARAGGARPVRRGPPRGGRD